MRSWRFWLAGVAVALCVVSADAQTPADHRVALVIGNAKYAIGPLHNPINDARGMAQALRGLGFDVIALEDADATKMRRAAADFGERLREGGVGLFYYSGHGLQVNGKNHLVPIGAEIKSERYVAVETLDVDSVLAQMDSAKTRLNILVLDACRDNPFARRFRSLSRGLAFMDAPPGTFIAYATSPGSVAADGDPGRNGLYTGELLKVLREPGLTLEGVFKRVAQNVIKQTRGRQTPWLASSFTGDFAFTTTLGRVMAARPPEPAPAPQGREGIRREVGSLALSSSVAGVEVFLGDQRIWTSRPSVEYELSGVRVGTYTIVARKDGHRDWKRDVRIDANHRTEVVIDIDPLASARPYWCPSPNNWTGTDCAEALASVPPAIRPSSPGPRPYWCPSPNNWTGTECGE